jgi:hypothetical protein
MFYYNVTCKIEPSIKNQWLEWMQTVHIPEVLATNCFTDAKMMLLIDPVLEEEGPTYAIQYTYKSAKDFETYLANYAPELKQKTLVKFGDSFLAFRSHLQIIHQF